MKSGSLGLGADAPPRVLRGFDRLYIQPGKSATFKADLLRQDVSTWDLTKQNWQMARNILIYVGSSSRNLPLSTKVML